MDIIELAEMLGFRLYPGGTKAKKMLCIFHEDRKTPNLTLYGEDNRFYCFVCGGGPENNGGDIYDFYAKAKNITRDQAIAELKDQDIKITPARVKHKGQQITQDRGKYSGIYKAFIDYLREQNKNKPEQAAMYYLHKTRLLTDETIKRFYLCILPEGRREYLKVKKHMTDRFTVEELQQAGILNKGNTGLRFIRHRVIIPIIENCKVIGLKGRYFYKGTAEAPAKRTYTTTAGLRGVLFNGDILRIAEPGDEVILCEGEFDTMICGQERKLKGRSEYVTGLLSTAYWTEETIRRFADYRLILALDNDTAGHRARRAIQKLYTEVTGKKAGYFDLPAGCKDVTDYYRSEKIGQEKNG